MASDTIIFREIPPTSAGGGIVRERHGWQGARGVGKPGRPHATDVLVIQSPMSSTYGIAENRTRSAHCQLTFAPKSLPKSVARHRYWHTGHRPRIRRPGERALHARRLLLARLRRHGGGPGRIRSLEPLDRQPYGPPTRHARRSLRRSQRCRFGPRQKSSRGKEV